MNFPLFVTRRSAIPLVLLGLTLSAMPVRLAACPVCFSAKTESRVAYYTTTVVLSAVPFFLVGGFVVGIRRRAREIAAADAVDSQRGG